MCVSTSYPAQHRLPQYTEVQSNPAVMANRVDLGVASATSAPTPPQISSAARATEAALRHALKADRHNHAALYQLAVLLVARGELKQGAKFLAQLCELARETPALWLELAGLWLQANAPRDALQAARRGLAAGADLFTAHCQIAEAAERAGLQTQAIAAYHAALLIRPEAWAVHNNLALLHRRRGECAFALDACERALALASEQASLHNNLGNILRDMGRLDDALAAYTTAVTLDPTVIDLHHNRGLVLLQLNQSAAAHAAFEQVLTQAPMHREAAIQSIEALISAGHFQAAQTELNAVLARWPTFAHAWFLRAQIARDPVTVRALIDSLRELRGAPSLAVDDAVYLDFALGKLCDNAGAYDDAFHFYSRGNRQRGSALGTTRRKHLRESITAMGALPPALWIPRATPPQDSRRPLFIIGMPRSGTTLVEQILSAHPAVAAAGEVDYFGAALAWLNPHDGRAAAVVEMLKRVGTTHDDHLRAGFLRRLTALGVAEGAIVTDKTPLNFLYVGLLQRLFPEAKFIHCVRHPLDTCLSIYFQLFGGLDFACDLGEIAEVYRRYCELMARWRATTAAPLFVVHYESLVANPEEQIRELLEFAGLPWDPHCIESHLQARTINTPSRWQARQPIYAHSSGRWQHYAKHLTKLELDFASPQEGGG